MLLPAPRPTGVTMAPHGGYSPYFVVSLARCPANRLPFEVFVLAGLRGQNRVTFHRGFAPRRIGCHDGSFHALDPYLRPADNKIAKNRRTSTLTNLLSGRIQAAIVGRTG